MSAALAAKNTPEKPATGAVKTMQRADYNRLEALAQAAFIKAGGKLED